MVNIKVEVKRVPKLRAETYLSLENFQKLINSAEKAGIPRSRFIEELVARYSEKLAEELKK